MVELDGDCKVAQLRESAAHILDVLVHAEDFLHDEDYRKLAVLVRHGAIRGHGAIARDEFYFSGDKALVVGRDHCGGDRLDAFRKTLRQPCGQEITQADGRLRHAAAQYGFAHVVFLSRSDAGIVESEKLYTGPAAP